MHLDPIYLIAECGINHSGSLDLAKRMIKAAADAGMNAVKFQKRSIEQCYTKEFLGSPRESPWGNTQRHQKFGLEFDRTDYTEINRYCKELGIAWSASAWDMESLEFVESFNPPWHKVASPMLGHKPFLRRVAELKRKTYISTGMSTLGEIREVIEIFRAANCDFTLMHCNSTYPMQEDQANLLMIPKLRMLFDCKVGYSGHETSLIKVCVVAATLGACVIERHLTLDRCSYGSDQAASIECSHLHEFVATMRAMPGIMGNGEKEITATEWAARLKLRKDVP